MINPTIADHLILALVTGLDPERAARSLGVGPDQIGPMVAEARRRLTLAAEFNRDEQLGTAIARLNECYSKASKDKDVRTCVQAQKELNRLLDLYRSTTTVTAGSAGADQAAAQELASVRAHLLPLKLAGEASDQTGTPELARLAVNEIVTLRFQKRDG
jgi:hypothetical protein